MLEQHEIEPGTLRYQAYSRKGDARLTLGQILRGLSLKPEFAAFAAILTRAIYDIRGYREPTAELAARITEALGNAGPLSAQELGEDLNVSIWTVDAALRSMEAAGNLIVTRRNLPADGRVIQTKFYRVRTVINIAE